MTTKVNGATVLAPVSNGAEELIGYETPYRVLVTIQGTADILFHAWNSEAVEEKARAAKNSKAKKSDNLESYVYWTEQGTIGIKGEALCGSIREAARYRQDPRSPRKSAMDLIKAGVISLTALADTGAKTWDYVDRARVVIQRSAITRERPALRSGWMATFDLVISTPEYISESFLLDLLTQAGRLIGIGDHRPTYGRFAVVKFERQERV